MAAGPAYGGVVGIIVTVVLTLISTAFVGLRFWSRGITKFGLWIDDWLALATLGTMFWALIISAMAVMNGGLGKPLVQAVTDDANAVTELLKVHTPYLLYPSEDLHRTNTIMDTY